MDELTLTDPDGVDIFYRRWIPTGSPRAIVLVLHGASEHSGRYRRFAEALRAEGYAVYADDHRGHGRTGGGHGVGTQGPRGSDGVLDAIAAVHRQAVADNGNVPVVVFGHSMGSVLTQVYAQLHGAELAGFVLCGSMGPIPELGDMITGMQAAVDAGMGDQPMDALGSFNAAFEPARTEFDWLSRDEAEVDAYLADPFCGAANPLTYGFVLGTLELLQQGSDQAAIGTIPDGRRRAAHHGHRRPGLGRRRARAPARRLGTATPGWRSRAATTPTPATSCSTRRTAPRSSKMCSSGSRR